MNFTWRISAIAGIGKRVAVASPAACSNKHRREIVCRCMDASFTQRPSVGTVGRHDRKSHWISASFRPKCRVARSQCPSLRHMHRRRALLRGAFACRSRYVTVRWWAMFAHRVVPARNQTGPRGNPQEPCHWRCGTRLAGGALLEVRFPQARTRERLPGGPNARCAWPDNKVSRVLYLVYEGFASGYASVRG